MIAVGLALLTFLGWGSGDVIGTITSRRLGALRASLAITGCMLLLLAIIAPFMSMSELHWPAVWQSAVLGIVLAVGYLSFVEGLRISNPTLVGTIGGSFTALTVILSLVFLHERLNAPQLGCIGVIVAGITGASLDMRSLRAHHMKLDRSILLSFVALVSWGVYFAFMKVPISDAGWYWPSIISTASGALLYALCYLLRKNSLGRANWRNGLKPAFFTGLVSGMANVLYNMALSHGNVSVVSPIAGSYLVLFVVLASHVFREALTRQQTTGIVITVCGVVGLSVLSA